MLNANNWRHFERFELRFFFLLLAVCHIGVVRNFRSHPPRITYVEQSQNTEDEHFARKFLFSYRIVQIQNPNAFLNKKFFATEVCDSVRYGDLYRSAFSEFSDITSVAFICKIQISSSYNCLVSARELFNSRSDPLMVIREENVD